MMILAAGCVAITAPAHAQTSILAGAMPQARIIEWDLPAQVDASPGAMVVDSQGEDQHRIWFVTRVGGPPHVYRMDFPSSLMRGNARWTRWDLSEASVTGGLRKIRTSRDRRFVFARTVETLERIDTQNCGGSPQTCERTVWTDQADGGFNMSDVAVDDRNNVFTTHAPMDDPAKSYVERLTPGTPSNAPATITRWFLPGGGAGLCTGGTVTSPCVSGVTVHPTNRNLVYFAEQSTNDIAELNTMTNNVRRWSLAKLSAASCPPATTCTPIAFPRQLNINRQGKVWGITGSGHLVSLDPSTSKMTSHEMPNVGGADPFGVAPDDDVVGYTNSVADKVGMLIPHGQEFLIPADPATPVVPPPFSLDASVQAALVFSSTVAPDGKTVPAQITKKGDDTYIEALIGMPQDSTKPPSQIPFGITPAKAKSQGTFFYAVGDTTTPDINRVGFVRLPVKERIRNPRDDDDRDDGCACEDHWHDWHDHANAGDDDDDGISNKYDDPSARENVAAGDPAPLAVGATADQSMVASPTTLALIAIAEADNPLAQIGIDIYNPAGLLVARSVPALGIAVAQVLLPPAGTYTWRVRNYGAAINYTPTTIVREPQPIAVLVP